MKKWLALALSFLMILALFVPGLAVAEDVEEDEYYYDDDYSDDYSGDDYDDDSYDDSDDYSDSGDEDDYNYDYDYYDYSDEDDSYDDDEDYDSSSSVTRDYYISDSDTRTLTRSELRQYSLTELGYIRNEILARHGFVFKTAKYNEYFGNQWWYTPNKKFSYSWLSKTEARNVELIQEIEAEGGNGKSRSTDYYIEDSDTRLLTKSELRGYTLSELGYIRNEILARHGFVFKTAKYKEYFGNQWWYTPNKKFSYDWLSSTEMKNVELIKQIEQEKS